MKKYVLVGAGYRGIHSYSIPLTRDYSEYVKLYGAYDPNYKRAKLVGEKVGYDVPVFKDFDEMLKATNPDVVIVTTRDNVHDHYIIKALDFGCDVISEKPLTTDEHKLRDIYEAKQRSDRVIRINISTRSR